MIERKIEVIVAEYAKESPVLAFVGARQSGKTTLVKKLFPNYRYYNLENINDFNIIKEDINSAINVDSPYVIVDEVQRMPELMSHIQAVVDEQRIMGSVIISGSQNILMSQSISQSLAGRAAYIDVPGLTQSEIGTVVNQSLNQAIFTGQYPVLYDRNVNPIRFYQQYIATYVERDVRQIKNINNLDAFRVFLTLLAGRVGQVFNAESIANDVGISQKTAKEWLSILQASYLVFELKPYFANIRKQVVKRPKVFFYDTGLLCNLLGISDAKDLNSHYLVGNIFENFIIADVVKEQMSIKDLTQFYFYRDKVGNEVDLLIKRGNTFSAVEIKRGQTFTSDYLKGLKKWNEVEITGVQREGMSYVVYTGETKFCGTEFELLNWRNATSRII